MVSKTQPDMVAAMNRSGSYFFYASFCAVGTVLLVLFLPETKGKSPDEMREHFGGRSDHNDARKKSAD